MALVLLLFLLLLNRDQAAQTRPLGHQSQPRHESMGFYTHLFSLLYIIHMIIIFLSIVLSSPPQLGPRRCYLLLLQLLFAATDTERAFTRAHPAATISASLRYK